MALFSRMILVLALGLVAGCATMRPSDFAESRPLFEPTKFFAGRTSSFGVMEVRSGAPKEIVRTKTTGHWEGDILHLEQDLFLGEAERQHRSWQIRKLDQHRYEATANDVVGTIHGEADGNAFHWTFTLKLPPGSVVTKVQMSQWMYLQPGGRTMLNHTTIRKFGIVVAQVTEQFRRE